MNQYIKQIQKNKKIRSNNLCYRKVESVITKWGAIEKSQKLLSQCWENVQIVVQNFIRILGHQ